MKYAAIIGKNPSKGARSPKLWNKVFSYYNHPIKMIPLDVEEKNLENIIQKLEKDNNFIGGAITNPYKELVLKYINNNCSDEAAKIGAINCIYRDKDNKLFGINTDGEAALKSFDIHFGKIKNKNILLFGLGGAGKAVSTYFAKEYSDNLVCISRKETDKEFCAKLNCKWLHRDLINSNLVSQSSVIINCTSLGSEFLKDQLPFNSKYIDVIKKNTLIFDIIYIPFESKLIKECKKKGIKCLNGSKMNIYQAALAYFKSAPIPKNLNKIFDIMSNNEE